MKNIQSIMARYKRILNLTTALAIAVVGLATLTEADLCMWCNQEMSLNFMNCMSSEVMNNRNFNTLQREALDAMTNSMIAASSAIEKSSESMKMRMMNGAFAGELTELIKSQGIAQNPEKAKSDMMEIVANCYIRASGLPHYSFTQALVKTVSFMLNEQKEPPYGDSDSKTNYVPTQYPAQTSPSSAALSGQNNIPPNFYGAPPQQQSFKQPVLNNFAPNQRYIPPPPPPPKTSPGVISNYPNTELQQASPSSAALSGQINVPPNIYGAPLQQQSFKQPVLNNFAPNQIYIPPPPPKTSGVISNYRNTGLQYPVQLASGQSETNAVSLTYSSNKQDNVPYIREGPNVQPQRTQTNAVSSSDSFEQNKWPNFAPNTPIQQNNNAENSSALFKVNLLNIRQDQSLPQNKGSISNSASSSAINDQRNLPDFITGPAIKLPDSVAISDAKAFAFKDQSAPPYYPQNQFVQTSNLKGGVLGQNGAYSLNNVNNSPNKLDQSTAGASFFNELKPKNDYISKIPAPIISYNKPQQNYDYDSPPITSYKDPQPNYDIESPPITSNEEPLPNYDYESPPITSYEEPQPDCDNASDNLVPPSSYDYQPNNDYYSNYPKQPSTYSKLNYEYEPEYPAQPSSNNKPQPNYNNDSKYPPPDISRGSSSSSSGSSVVTNDNTSDATSQRNGYPSDYSQPKNTATKAPGRKSKTQPKRSKYRNRRPPAKAKSNDVTNQKSSPPSRKDDSVARAMRFAETVYVMCSESDKFNRVFNKLISKNKASSYMYKNINGALKYCGYSEYSAEIANACSVAIKSLSGKSSSVKYAETMSKSLMDQFYMKKLIGENPEDQAQSITTAFLARLKKKKSPGSSKPAKFSKLSSSSTVSTTVSPLIYKDYGPDYRIYTDYRQNYPIYTNYRQGDSSNPGIPKYQNYPTTQKVAVSSGTSSSNPGENDGTRYANDDDGLTTQDSGYGDTNYSEPDSQPNDDYQYYGDYPPYPVNKSPKEQSPGKAISQTGPNMNTGSYYKYYDYNNGDYKDDFNYPYYDNPSPQINERPNQRPPGNQAYLLSPDYNKTPESNVIQNDGSDEGPRNTRTSLANAGTSSATKESKKSKAKHKKNGKNKNPVANNDSDINSSTSGENQSNSKTRPGQNSNFPTYDTTNTQPQQSDFTGFTSYDEGENFYPDTVLASANAQTNPDNTEAEGKERMKILMKWALLSISNGKFNYKIFSSVISALAKYVQNTHPEWGSQKCLQKVLIDSVIACTQLLIQIPTEYLAKIGVPNDTDAAMANWLTKSSEQENKDSVQTDKKNVAQYDQSYVTPQIPPQQNNRNSMY